MSLSDPSPRGGDADGVPSEASAGADQASVPQNGGRRQAVDPAVLDELAEQLQSPDIAHRFARDYAALWEQRQRRLTSAVEGQDHAAALDAVISLKTSSAMVGGRHLAFLAGKLQAHIQAGDLHSGQALLLAVADSGRATVHELRLGYLLKKKS
ncbi:Hpt domain-containing protein [Arthrobacter sp. Soil736]|uniref:Hpt domain-containing protein n=1 Tax=Arthrobacter sp. Soil736 TaxID=1736395 RepID=UPI000B07FEB7|nr:Hpt domain-containing protein [Arthrobacter sp. Soil736]